MDTDSDEDQIVKYNTALLANDSVTLKKTKTDEHGHTQ